MTEPDWAALEAAGLYDPGSPAAEGRRRLLVHLLDLGCSLDEMLYANARGRLFGLGGDRVMRPGRDSFTLKEVAEQLDTDVELLHRIWRTLGFVNRGVDEHMVTPDEVEALRTCVGQVAIYGEEEALRLFRTYGRSVATMADAITSMVRHAVQEMAVDISGDELVTAQSYEFAVSHIRSLGHLLDVMHRQHIEVAVRQFELADSNDLSLHRLIRIAVGFADVSGYTTLSEVADSQDLARLIDRFEGLAHDVARECGGRVVKFIGDAAMFVAPTPDGTVDIAVRLVDAFQEEDVQLRAGVAYGEMVSQDGDFFGSPVNLAARLVGLAEVGTVLGAASVVNRLDPEAWSIGEPQAIDVRGFAEPVICHHLTAPSATRGSALR